MPIYSAMDVNFSKRKAMWRVYFEKGSHVNHVKSYERLAQKSEDFNIFLSVRTRESWQTDRSTAPVILRSNKPLPRKKSNGRPLDLTLFHRAGLFCGKPRKKLAFVQIQAEFLIL